MRPNLSACDGRRSSTARRPARFFGRSAWVGGILCAQALLLVALSPSPGLAADKQACVDAYREAQRARRDGDLLRAREQLLLCARPECPATVSNDCVPWLADVQQALPSVVLVARTQAGRDLVNVTVTLDGKPFATRLDGRPVDINPGVHAFRFETAGFPATEQEVVIAATEKNRVISITLDGGAPIAPAAAPSTPHDGHPEKVRPVPTLVYVMGGVGLIGWGGLTWYGLRFDSQVQDLNRCDPGCPQSQIDEAASTRRLAFVSMGIGVIGTGAAAYLFFTRPEREVSASASSRVSVALTPTRGGAHAAVMGSF